MRDLVVYEPVGKPSERFLQIIEPYAYVARAELGDAQERQAAPTESGQPSAIAFAQQRMREKSNGLTNLLTGAKMSTQDEGEYRVFKGESSDPIATQVLSELKQFCQSLQGEMFKNACRRGQGDDVLFFQRYRSVYALEVYEPVGAPSPRFFDMIRKYGYQIEVDRQAEEFAKQQRAEEERARREREAQEAAKREKPLTAPSGASISRTPGSAPRTPDALQKAFDKQ